MRVRHLVSVIAVLAVGACGGVMPPAQPENAPLRIENTQMFITVENRSGLALRDLTVQIVPTGRATEYLITVPRLENGDKRDFPLGSFRGRDGTPFNLRVVRPKSVKVSGTNINNQVIEAEVAWQK